MSFPSKRDESVSLVVACLLFRRRPTAVAGFVVAVLVWIAVDGITGTRRLAHIGKKVKESVGAEPPLANTNPPSAVIGVFGVVDVVAAVPHGHPNVVDALAFAGPAVPVFCAALGDLGMMVTPARNRQTIAEARTGNDLLIAAFAAAEPTGPVTVFSAGENSEAAKSAADKINKDRHFPLALIYLAHQGVARP